MKALDELEKLVENIQGFDDTISYKSKQAAPSAANLFSGMVTQGRFFFLTVIRTIY